jgi:hypothetical protein
MGRTPVPIGGGVSGAVEWMAGAGSVAEGVVAGQAGGGEAGMPGVIVGGAA